MDWQELLKGRKVALYGLGTETERIIEEWSDKYELIGLLDGFVEEGEQFGYPILSMKEVLLQKDSIIVVVARPGSCKAIAKRIGEQCREKGVGLFDIRGNNLLKKNSVSYGFSGITGYRYEDLIRQIKSVDVVSFDLFDTLVSRDLMSSSDVIELVDARLQEQGIVIENFCEKRLWAEKCLSCGRAPRLEEIYKEAIKEGEVALSAKELADYEYRIDCSLLRKREEMFRLLQDAKRLGKRIYITSESYYGKKQIENILHEQEIVDVDDVVVSCEYNTGKLGMLFDQLIENAKTNNILHIGDDATADLDAAKRHGIRACQIFSGSDLLDMVGGLHLLEGELNLSDKIRIGMFISIIFNSPFQFEDEKRKICVESAHKIGYLFCAPMVYDFICWFYRQVEENSWTNIWFCARDGYLFYKLWQQLYPRKKAEYFLTSRIAAIRAGVREKKDIDYVDGMKFSGSLKENLSVRFGIQLDELCDADENSEAVGLQRYTSVILNQAKEKRKNYQMYIETLGGVSGTIAMFDFVAKGTTQMFLQRLVPNPLIGLYFLQLEPEFMRETGIKVRPFYVEEERESSAIFEDYYILETLFTSPEPSVDEFDGNGKPLYASETRGKADVSCLMNAQSGIMDYVKRYVEICPEKNRKVNKKLDEAFLTLIHHVDIRDEAFLKLVVEDTFFNRRTDLAEVM